ncbi:MAG: cupin domain-containing protein [Solirubrobacteraceae bacterium]
MNTGTKASIPLGAIRVDFLVEADDSGGSVTVFECLVPAGAKVPAPHSHDGFEETVYVLEGTCTWMVDGELLELGLGDSMCIRRGQVHGFDNRGEADARFLAIATPGVFGPGYFEDMAELIGVGGGPPDIAAIAGVMQRHGLTPAPPPLPAR